MFRIRSLVVLSACCSDLIEEEAVDDDDAKVRTPDRAKIQERIDATMRT